MKSFSAHLNEELAASSKEPQEICDKISAAFAKEFPHGWIKTHYSTKGLSGNTINVAFGIVPMDQAPSKILMNDPAYHQFIIFIENGKYEANNSIGNLSINPEAGSHMAMGRVKTKFRKTTGDAKKVVSTFETFFKRVKQIVRDNAENIYGVERFDSKYFK